MSPVSKTDPPHSRIRAALLAWYDANARDLPWRVRPAARAAGRTADPYKVWLSEVMLQQTTVPHAAPYFRGFTRRWPTVADLAAEADGEVMAAWAGLGYYARARNLLACARAVAADHGGVFPDTEDGLRDLPGVGAYTAAAVAAIAFDRPANVVDGNVERVMARIFTVNTVLPDAKPALKDLAAGFVTDRRPGDWAQALMDLGATICRPKAPLCERCPVAEDCRARAAGQPETWPRKRRKADRPRRHGVAYVIWKAGRVALIRRPDKGLLGGMLALPSGEWTAAPPPADPGDWRDLGEIEHTFTHFGLTLRVLESETAPAPADAVWLTADQAEADMPSVFAKALRQSLKGQAVLAL
jgi:A/G-specific adenine glycosylase